MKKGPLEIQGEEEVKGEQTEVIVDGGISQYKDYESIIKDDRHFVLKHRDDSLNIPVQEISLNDSANGLEWVGLPPALKTQLTAFSANEVE